jgi:hypothetical protein
MLKLFSKKKPEPALSPEEEYSQWINNGKPSPPPHIVKQRAIDDYRKLYNLDTLVETGTYLGDMVEAQSRNFGTIYSIELSKKLYSKAKKRFNGRPTIHLLQGDSGKVLNALVPQLNQPALFWLDGHYSGDMTAMGEKECPVIEEMKAILQSMHPHVILIDDARLFTGSNDYPAIAELEKLTETAGKRMQIETRDDIIRITPI